MNFALLLLRLVLGTAFAAHGAQKLFGWFGGYGIQGTGAFVESLGFRPGTRFAILLGLSEFLGGILLALGLLGPIGPAMMISVMVVAILTVHKGNGFFAVTNGSELPILYTTGALTIALAGPGWYSMDYLLLDFVVPRSLTLMVLAVAVLGAFANVAAARHKPQLPGQSAAQPSVAAR